MQAAVVEPDGGERVVDRPGHSVVVKGSDDLVDVAELRWGGGRPRPSLYIHRQHTDAFYVLEAEARTDDDLRAVRERFDQVAA